MRRPLLRGELVQICNTHTLLLQMLKQRLWMLMLRAGQGWWRPRTQTEQRMKRRAVRWANQTVKVTMAVE